MKLTELLVQRDGFQGSFVAQLCYDERSAYRRLKNRDWRISLHPMTDLAAIGVEGTPIFRAAAVARGDVAIIAQLDS